MPGRDGGHGGSAAAIEMLFLPTAATVDRASHGRVAPALALWSRIVLDGVIMSYPPFGFDQPAQPPDSDRRNGTDRRTHQDRRILADRRSGVERRRRALAAPAERRIRVRRTVPDRRSGLDRRSFAERRDSGWNGLDP